MHRCAEALAGHAQVPEAELLDVLDPRAQPKAFPGETCGDTRPVSFQYVPATALWEQYRFGGYYLKTHTDVSQVPGPGHDVCCAVRVAA